MSSPSTAKGVRRGPSDQDEAPRAEIFCSACGFGAIVSVEPARCPMCGSGDWRQRRASRLDGRLRQTNGAGQGGLRRKEQVMGGLDCERTAGR